MSEVSVNISAQVSFETTPEGARIMREHYACTPALAAREVNWLASRRTLPLWEVMQVFGPHTYMGGPSHIKGNVLTLETGDCVKIGEAVA